MNLLPKNNLASFFGSEVPQKYSSPLVNLIDPIKQKADLKAARMEEI